jgi:tetratricopeptide (TPR) repeat protein
VLTVIGVGGLWHFYDGQSVRRPLRALVSEGIAAHEHGQLALAIEKLRKAARMDVRRSELRDLRDLAERRLILVEAEQALAQNDFASAEDKLREAESRGANASIIGEIQQQIWARKDANRLLAEGIEDLDRGDLTSVELKMDEYEQRAPKAGVDPMELRNRLELSRKERKHAEAIERARSALADNDYDGALFACRDAENIETTSETRELHKRILDLQKRADWILRGDDALLNREFEEAAAAYEKANQIEASDKIETRARIARAYELYHRALKDIAKGELLAAERDLRSSLWRYPTKEARSKLAKMATAFEAARLVRKADRALRRSEYAEAERLYAEALPNLPPPADAIVKAKLQQIRRPTTTRQARPTSAKRNG